MTYTFEQELQDAIKFVDEWRWDDEALRMPMNPFGAQLGHAIDVLVEHAKYGNFK